ncbi:MAG: hypothetical protein LQ342_006648 [Letrouitia transgressa]|nr:MAG: hypothetical protein LQ342_006648 [Letrouitia transgressa]
MDPSAFYDCRLALALDRRSMCVKETTSLTNSVRTLMRQVPHPLTVVIAQHPHQPTPSGLLVSSFNTVTLAPTPYVSFNLKLPSSTFAAIEASGRFTASAINSAQLARAFLNNGTAPAGSCAAATGVVQNVQNGTLVKRGRGGVWWMHCVWTREKSTQVGDHLVIIGKVVQAGSYGASESQAGDQRMVYLDGKYQYVGQIVDHER